jgi:hypothetical protein
MMTRLFLVGRVGLSDGRLGRQSLFIECYSVMCGVTVSQQLDSQGEVAVSNFMAAKVYCRRICRMMGVPCEVIPRMTTGTVLYHRKKGDVAAINGFVSPAWQCLTAA